jgi:hypothetical protein
MKKLRTNDLSFSLKRDKKTNKTNDTPKTEPARAKALFFDARHYGPEMAFCAGRECDTK